MGRRLERIELSQNIAIEDSINGGHFGELVNITTEGLMLISDQQLEQGSIFQLALKLPAPLQDSEEIAVGVDCLWCREVEGFSRYWAGFQIIDIAPEALEQLEELISLYSK